MFAGITGLSAHSDKMSVIGNNLANVSTLGFKGTNMYFEDIMSQDMATASGIKQVGRGVTVSDITTDFAQGSFQTTSESTDMAIGGNGFFEVKTKGQDSTYYTRAGEFRFDKDGYLTDPNGYVLQGWQVDRAPVTHASNVSEIQTGTRIKGAPTDIRLNNFQSEPQATTKVTMLSNLDSTATSKSDGGANPYFALGQLWNGKSSTPLSADTYTYSSTLKVYDSNGSSHDLTTYFDPVTVSNTGGKKVWEYIVTCNPGDDNRILGSANTRIGTTSAAGLLMMGTITFDTAGKVQGMSAYTLSNSSADFSQVGAAKDLSQWTPTKFSSEGYPVFTANFLGSSNASFPGASNASNIKMDFGLRNTDSTTGWSLTPGVNSAADVGNDISDISRLPKFASTEITAQTTTGYAAGSSTLSQTQDGFTAGFLQSVSVSRDGVLTGSYTNGQTLDLYVVTLADFSNKWGLRREGGNLFSQTRESGDATTNRPNQAGKGSIAGDSLEMSNVDMATEFVDMITTQRGFEANSKTITTIDSLLGEVIQMKR